LFTLSKINTIPFSSVGYAVTPGAGALLSFADIDIIGEDLEVNAFSGSGYVMAFFGICNLLMMIFLWVEPPKCKNRKEKEKKRNVANHHGFI